MPSRSLRGLVLPALGLLSAVLTGLYVLDLLTTSARSSGCEMTYSWPVYTPLVYKGSTGHHKYRLVAIDMHAFDPELTGQPVLFIPGHLGSHKQARSIARHLHDRDPRAFDVFAVDFGEELTGLSGRLLERQAAFVNDAIRAILREYRRQARASHATTPQRPVPDGVLVFAHSMGGVVARLAERLPNYRRRSIRQVLALGSPFARPPFPFDPDAQRRYHELERWATTAAMATKANKAPAGTEDPGALYVSISGGHKDTTVHSALSVLTADGNGEDLAFLSSALPAVDVTIDHLCLLWCHQLLARIAESFADALDPTTGLLLEDRTTRLLRTKRRFLDLVKDESDWDNNGTMAALAAHRLGLLDGHHSAEEFSRYEMLLPRNLVRLFRLEYVKIFWIMFLVVVHILHLQLAHWQGRFNLQGQGTASTSAPQEPFPSFTTLLHPAAHAPAIVRRGLGSLGEALQLHTRSSLQLLGAGLGVAVVVGAVLVETIRHYEPAAAVIITCAEYLVLYADAIGLIYLVSLVLKVLRAIAQPVVRVIISITRRARLRRWFYILCVYAVVFVLGHLRDYDLAPLNSTPRHAALLVLGSAVVFVLHLIELGIKQQDLTTDQLRYRSTLFAFFTLSCLPWVSQVVYFVDIVNHPPPVLTNDLLGHAALCISFLALFRYFITRTDSEMIPLPPTAFFDVEEDGGGAFSQSSSSSKVAITAENCPRCIFEDGGPGAIFVEYTNKAKTRHLRTKNQELVTVGPTFRVVACDCVLRFKQPREYCTFCTRACRLCGGGSGNYQQAQRYQEFLDKSKTDVAMHGVIALSLELCVLVMIVMQHEHYIFYVTPLITLLLAIYHGVLRHPIEAKQLTKELRKRQKKIDGTKAAAKKNKKKRQNSAKRKSGSKKTTTKDGEPASSSFMEEYAAGNNALD